MHSLAKMFAVFLLVGCTEGAPVPKRLSDITWKPNIEFRPAKYDPNMPIGGSCNFDEITDEKPIADVIEIKRSQQVKYVGWAALSPVIGIVGGDVKLLLVDSAGNFFDAPVQRQERQDVASYFSNSGLLASGFVAYIRATAVSPGNYNLFIVQRNKWTLKCPVGKKIVIY